MQIEPSTLQIGIIGAGKVGLSLAILCQSKGMNVVVGSRHPNQTVQSLAQRNLQLSVHSDMHRIARESTIIILAVADAEIQNVCEEIAPDLSSHSIVTHLAGALDSSILKSAQRAGAATASTHPLNTFPNLDAALAILQSNAHHSALFCEGEHTALNILTPFFTTLGFQCQTLNSKDKALYHAACVMACNYLTALVDASVQMAQSAGIDAPVFEQALGPILNTTLNNINKHGTLDALSGPIARGDATTVSAHMQALNSYEHISQLDPHFAVLYAALGQHALTMAAHKGNLNEGQITALRNALESKE